MSDEAPGTRRCPRCGETDQSGAPSCTKCGWIHEEQVLRPEEMTGYPGERAWRGFTWLVQLSGIGLLCVLAWPRLGEVLMRQHPFRPGRGYVSALAGAAVAYVLIGWGLRRQGPTRHGLAALIAAGALLTIATARGGPAGLLGGMTGLPIPLGLTLFPEEVGDALGYIPVGPTNVAGGAVGARVIGFLGWLLFLLLGWAMLASR